MRIELNPVADTIRNTGVLLVLPDAGNRASLSSILQDSGLRTFLCASARDAIQLLPLVSIVICEDSLPDGVWLDLLHSSQALPAPPAVIVTSRLAGVDLWENVLSLGGFDLLAQPFHRADVLWSVASAAVSAHGPRNDPPQQPNSPASATERNEPVLCLMRH